MGAESARGREFAHHRGTPRKVKTPPCRTKRAKGVATSAQSPALTAGIHSLYIAYDIINLDYRGTIQSTA